MNVFKDFWKKSKKPAKGKMESYKPPLVQLPYLGPKQVKILMNFVPSAIAYSATGALLTLYFTDWKLVLQFLPFYNGKFKTEEEKDE